MAQLWGGRFTKKTDQMVYDFNASISFDKRLYRQDIEGSMAHVRMLAKQQILTDQERDQILEGLTGILADVESGALQITSEYEDIHRLCGGEPDRPDRRRRQEAAHRTQPE